MDVVVTTAHNPTDEMINSAAGIAQKLNAPLVARANNSIDALRKTFLTEYMVIVTQKGPVVHTPGGEYFFHLSMAELRIKNLIIGKHDHMITAMGLSAGMSVLDCTIGLATDAIVASFIAGTNGKVHGLEASQLIATITGLGLSRFLSDNDVVTKALRRIRVEEGDYNTYLPLVSARSYDVVYFDPMFRVPIGSSSNLKPIRFLADNRPLSIDAILEARRIAKKRVVIKETNGSKEFSRLGISKVFGGKYSSVQYGVIEVGE